MMSSHNFKHVQFLWDEQKAKTFEGDEVELLVYRSNLLGSDLRLTNYGGGNTSCKVNSIDPLNGSITEVLWVKGSGGDLGTMKRNGLAALYLERLRSLRSVYRGLEFEDEMVGLFNHCIYDLNSKAPSIDTPLHSFLPFKHIDHLHPDAAIAIAASKNGKKITQELFGGKIGWVDWQRPGFDLGLQLLKCLNANPSIQGIMLGSHGLFTWGDTSYDCYLNSLSIVDQCANYLESQFGKRKEVFGGNRIQLLDQEFRRKQAISIIPLLRHFCSTNHRMVGHFNDSPQVLEFINSHDLDRLALLGTSCPDHFLRTKIRPLVIPFSVQTDLNNSDQIKKDLLPLFEHYRSDYSDYYNACKHPNSPAMRDPNPVVILWPGIGMFTFAKDKQTARVAGEFYVNAINVMKGAEAISEYLALPRQEAFNIEYWLLEEAKLQRMPKSKPLTGRIALVTGSAGGIGKGIALKFLEEGACVMLSDFDEPRLSKTLQEFTARFGSDVVKAKVMDVTKSGMIHAAVDDVILNFGGLDLLVNNAGISISKSLEMHKEQDWDLLYDVLVKGQFLVSSIGVQQMKRQSLGGDIINIVSKNALVSGPNNSGYGSAKAAQLHMTRLLAVELGPHKIRVNSVNPDAVIADSKIWEGAWAEGRAKAYGIRVDELPAFYASRTLLNEVILPVDIANACFALVGGLLNKSTGNMINVDGGIAPAFPR